MLNTNPYPALSKLRLSAEHLATLRTNGYLASEVRRGKTVYKLRFRHDGQVVRYIGDAAAAEKVRVELDQLRTAQRAQRRLKQLAAAAAQLRENKTQLDPILRSAGFKFHGRAIRRPRRIRRMSTQQEDLS